MLRVFNQGARGMREMRRASTQTTIRSRMNRLGVTDRQGLVIIGAIAVTLTVATAAGAQYLTTNQSAAPKDTANQHQESIRATVETEPNELNDSETVTPTPDNDTPQDQSANAAPETTSAPQISTDVTVNGTPVPVPQNGSHHQIIQDDNGTTSVDITVNSQSSDDNSSRSSSDLRIRSSTRSSLNIENSE